MLLKQLIKPGMWLMPVIAALGRQKDQELKAILGYMTQSQIKQTKITVIINTITGNTLMHTNK